MEGCFDYDFDVKRIITETDFTVYYSQNTGNEVDLTQEQKERTE